MQSADEPALPESVGSALAAARQRAGLTVDEVSERTRIRASLISQIEQDDFSGCGGAVYARGHIRSIARTLGLDPEPLLAAYDAGHESVPSPLVLPSPEFDPLRGRAPSGGGFRWMPAMIASAVVLCLLAVVALLLPGSEEEEPRNAAAGVTAPPSAPLSQAPADTAPPPTVAPTTPPPSGVNVRVEARDAQSWLEIRNGTRQVLVQQLLQQGDSREVSDEHALEVRMGNAGAVDLSCNGQSLGTPGGPGEVVTIRLVAATTGECMIGDENGQMLPGLQANAPQQP